MNDEIIYSLPNGGQVRIPFSIVFSPRRTTIAIQIEPNGSVTVRAPSRTPRSQIYRFIREKRLWIIRHYAQIRQKERENSPEEEEDEADHELIQRIYRKKAASYFPGRVKYLNSLTGGTYNRVSIRNQKTRWGSCSAKGTLSFNWRLMLAPKDVSDYVIVHELCHLTYMNHSRDFWDKVASVCPEYKTYRKWLKDNGERLMRL